jgi:hypothetical protein
MIGQQVEVWTASDALWDYDKKHTITVLFIWYRTNINIIHEGFSYFRMSFSMSCLLLAGCVDGAAAVWGGLLVHAEAA